MSDGSGIGFGDGPPDIDVRSPGERWLDSGRAGIARVHAQPVAAAAICWMLAVVLIVAIDVYNAWHLASGQFLEPGFTTDFWVKVTLLSESSGLTIAVAALVGLALAALSRESRARTAFVLGVVLGAWTAIAGVCGIAAALHSHDYLLTSGTQNRFVFGLLSFANLVLGAIVTDIAVSLARAGPAAARPDRGTEPEIAELS